MRARVEESWGLRFSLLIRSSLYVIFRQRLRVAADTIFENQQDSTQQSTFSQMQVRVCDPLPIGIAFGIAFGIGIWDWDWIGLGLGDPKGDPWVTQASPKGHASASQASIPRSLLFATKLEK